MHSHRAGMPPEKPLDALTAQTIAHYDASADAFWEGTRSHDVSQNYAAFLGAIEGEAPLTLLDLGCGPGRDVLHFASLGHAVTGLDGSARFVEMARQRTGCPMLHQDFLQLELPDEHFDGIFANASLFHVPRAALPGVLSRLWEALRPRGVLFSSNPRGPDREGTSGRRYGYYVELPTWRRYMTAAGFEEVGHYYRPEGLPRAEQPWLASVWRRAGDGSRRRCQPRG
jgi:SAM-dependent methyltransferase